MSTLAFGVESVAKASLVLAVGLGLLPLLRARSAAFRHWVLSLAIAGAAVAPAAAWVLPTWTVGFNSSWFALADSPAGGTAGSATEFGETTMDVVAGGGRESAVTLAARVKPAGRALALVWAAGFGLSLALLAVGLARLGWIAARSRRMDADAWNTTASEISADYGLQRAISLLHSEHSTLLVAWGLFRPAIILPRPATEWSEERARMVLAHELAHVARGDWAVQMLAELVRAVYWFNPLAWLACRRLRHESERAADDAVLRRGVNGCEYATELIALARELALGRRPAVPALAMARPSGLQRRVSAMVNTQLDHTAGTWRSRLTSSLLVLALVGPVVSARPASPDDAAVQVIVSGVVVDPMGRPMPGVRIVATGADGRATWETHSDVEGRYELAGLPAGEYRIAASAAGFRTQLLTGVVVDRNAVATRFIMQVGALSEHITVRGDPQAVETAVVSVSREPVARPPVRRDVECVSGSSGGNIREPRKIRDVRPSYPAHLVSEGVSGVVILEGIVATDGRVTDVQVLREPHPDLAEAAVEAVRQWAFTPTLLNCEPIDVVITVTINFGVGQ